MLLTTLMQSEFRLTPSHPPPWPSSTETYATFLFSPYFIQLTAYEKRNAAETKYDDRLRFNHFFYEGWSVRSSESDVQRSLNRSQSCARICKPVSTLNIATIRGVLHLVLDSRVDLVVRTLLSQTAEYRRLSNDKATFRELVFCRFDNDSG